MSYVQGNSHFNGATSSTTVAVTLGSLVGAGHGLCVAVGFSDDGTAAVTNVTDDQNNSYVLAPTKVRDAAHLFSFQGAYTLNVGNAPQTITATMNGSIAFLAILADEFSGLVSADGSIGQAQDSPGTSPDAVTSGPVVTTTNGDLIWAASVNIFSSGINEGSGFTPRQNVISTYCTESRTQSAAGSVAGTFTTTDAGASFDTIVLAFSVAASSLSYTLTGGMKVLKT